MLRKNQGLASLQYSPRQIIRQKWRRIIASQLAQASREVMFVNPSDLVGQNVQATGQYEGDFLTLVAQLLGEQDVVLDLGANIGTHSVFFSRIAKRVLAFEPHPATALVHQANMLIAGANNVETFAHAVSSTSEAKLLYLSQPDALHVPTIEAPRDDSMRSIVVHSVVIDDFVLPRLAKGERVTLVKMDVEGHEPAVLDGMSQLIDQHRPVIIFEALNDEKYAECAVRVRDHCYRVLIGMQRSWDRKSNIVKAAQTLLGRKQRMWLEYLHDPIPHVRERIFIAMPDDHPVQQAGSTITGGNDGGQTAGA